MNQSSTKEAYHSPYQLAFAIDSPLQSERSRVLDLANTQSIKTMASNTDRTPPQMYEKSSRHTIADLRIIDQSQQEIASGLAFPCLVKSHTLPAVPSISSRRGFNLQRIPIDDLLAVSSSVAPKENRCPVVSSISTTPRATAQSPSCTNQHTIDVPLTPPADTDLAAWRSKTHMSNGSDSISSHVDSTVLPAQSQTSNGTGLPSGASSSVNHLSGLPTAGLAGIPWIDRLLNSACVAATNDAFGPSIKVISQVLPMNACDQRSIKTYEMICDRLQQMYTEPRSITITHARKISPGQVVEDFPRSPPATSYHNSGDSYFGDQTFFTHVAEVPVHHDMRTITSNLEPPAQRHIMIAEASNVILERYIPPTTAKETLDLFNADSCRSYLADRLPELASNGGSLVLIYPTKSGAQNFARHYVGPVLDPLLREMSILRGLNTNAAERLGSMKGIDAMFDFQTMHQKLEELCTSLNSRASSQRSRTEFAIRHSEKAGIVLDRSTWTTWFVEQEQQRMKQDLVEYHHEGGALPDTDNVNTEVTAGMLAREVTDGFRKSTKSAGDVEIEVGVFVIHRNRKCT